MIRQLLVWLHRYAGLGMSLFLVIAALTGSLLAYNSELERVFAPQLFAQPHPGEAPLDLATLAERAASLVPNARVSGVSFDEVDQVKVGYVPEIDPATGNPHDLGFNQFYVDPWTGKELGRRIRGDLSEGLINLMPFIYILHFNLQLGGVGMLLMGVVALVWTVDCFTGFYLTLPVSLPGFWRRWKSAWQVKRGASFLRLNFDLHRVNGLWLWAALFIFAWSSVMLNIRPVYEWVTRKVVDHQSLMQEFMSMPKNRVDHPALDWRAAQATGERLMQEQSEKLQFTYTEPLSLTYFPGAGLYFYDVRGSRDVFERSPKGGSTSVWFDGNTGQLYRVSVPTGMHAGNTIDSWLYALHMARVFGRPYQLFVFLIGFAITILSVTGIVIWWKKRRARRWTHARRYR